MMKFPHLFGNIFFDAENDDHFTPAPPTLRALQLDKAI